MLLKKWQDISKFTCPSPFFGFLQHGVFPDGLAMSWLNWLLKSIHLLSVQIQSCVVSLKSHKSLASNSSEILLEVCPNYAWFICNPLFCWIDCGYAQYMLAIGDFLSHVYVWNQKEMAPPTSLSGCIPIISHLLIISSPLMAAHNKKGPCRMHIKVQGDPPPQIYIGLIWTHRTGKFSPWTIVIHLQKS